MSQTTESGVQQVVGTPTLTDLLERIETRTDAEAVLDRVSDLIGILDDTHRARRDIAVNEAMDHSIQAVSDMVASTLASAEARNWTVGMNDLEALLRIADVMGQPRPLAALKAHAEHRKMHEWLSEAATRLAHFLAEHVHDAQADNNNQE